MRLTGLKVRNFKSLRDVEMRDIPPMAVLVGANGSGKSTIFDLFAFVRDCLRDDLGRALGRRGGFEEVATRGFDHEAIWIEFEFASNEPSSHPVRYTYTVEFRDNDHGPYISVENLREIDAVTDARPVDLIYRRQGVGSADAKHKDSIITLIIGAAEGDNIDEYALNSARQLGLALFSMLSATPRAVLEIQDILSSLGKCDINTKEMRSSEKLSSEHLSPDGGNIAEYAHFLHEKHPDQFANLIKKLSWRVPGITGVLPKQSSFNKQHGLQFHDSAFALPFEQWQMSDGTLKWFTYLALLHDPDPHRLLLVEEPENFLYPSLLGTLAEEFAAYAERQTPPGQVIVATHSPDFVNAVPLESVYWLTKTDGFTTIHRAADDPQLVAFAAEGDLPGRMWRLGMLEGADPK